MMPWHFGKIISIKTNEIKERRINMKKYW